MDSKYFGDDLLPVICKYCGQTAAARCGLYRGTQLYFCKSCRRKFRNDDSLFHMSISADCVAEGLELYFRGTSVRGIREYLQKKYGYFPPRSVIHQWVNKYSQRAADMFCECRLVIGQSWIVSEALIKWQRRKLRYFDIVDTQTHILIATVRASAGEEKTVDNLLAEAMKVTGQKPGLILAEMPYSRFIRFARKMPCETEHLSGSAEVHSEGSRLVFGMHSIMEPRAKVIETLRTTSTVDQFLDHWLLQYNFFCRQISLGEKTPAEMAQIVSPVRNWKDVVRLYQSPKARGEST